jgi:AAA domain
VTTRTGIASHARGADDVPWPDAPMHSDPAAAALDDRPLTGADSALTTYSLATLIRDGVPPPQLLPGDLLYAGGIHVISGEPDSGKTTLALWQMLGLLRTGRTVLMLDEEGGAEMTAEKLIALGATERDVARLHYVPFPARTWTADDVAGLAYTAVAVRPDLVLVDSAAAFLARAGLDENAAADVTRFWQHVLVPLAREHGAAVLIIDHDAKNTAGSRFSRGSGAKLAASDVMVKVELVKPFSRAENGVLRLAVTKDRRGWLHRWWDVQVRTGGGLSLVLAKGDEQGSAEARELTPAERKVESVLDGTPATIPELTERIAARHGHGLKRETVSRALNKLLRHGRADHIDQGAGRAGLWLNYQGLTCDQAKIMDEV